MSQYEIAKQLGVTHQSVSNWYTGKSLPSLENLVALAGLLNVEYKTLIDDFLKKKEQYMQNHKIQKVYKIDEETRSRMITKSASR